VGASVRGVGASVRAGEVCAHAATSISKPIADLEMRIGHSLGGISVPIAGASRVRFYPEPRCTKA
jgi:hypothetical protein